MPRRANYTAPDDTPLFVVKRDLSGGQNSRQHPQIISDNQAVLLQNILLETAGETQLREGCTLVDVDFPVKTTVSLYYVSDDDGNLVTDDDGNLIPIP